MEHNKHIDDFISKYQLKIQNMEKKTSELFEELGLSSHQLHHYLNDPANFTPAAYKELQRYNLELETLLEQRIEQVKSTVKRKPSPRDMNVKGHWLFMR